MHVVIIGAGWAGLATAIELSRAGNKVTLVEAAKHPGGRARRVEVHNTYYDNGQHLMAGAYRELLRLLSVIGVREEEVFHRHSLRVDMRTGQRTTLCIDFPSLPAPWHVLSGFIRAAGLGWKERYRALALCARLFISDFRLTDDLQLSEWLRRAKQSPLLISTLWEPLCLAILNTPLHQASAVVFIRVLHEIFAGPRSHSDLLFPRKDLTALFPDPALRFIREHGGAAMFGERVLTLEIRNDRLQGVTTRQGMIAADHVVIAASPGGALRLMQVHPQLLAACHQIEALRYEPICTVYLQYSHEQRLGSNMLGLLGGRAQWIFDLADSGHPGRMAVVISGPGPHMSKLNDVLIDDISREVSEHFPHWPAPSHAYVMREKRATFSCHAGVAALRPSNRMPVEGCWLAGDFTDTGLPATLEGALRSGVHAARMIIETNTRY